MNECLSQLTEPKVSPIENQLRQNDRILNRLNCAVDDLIKKINPILIPETPTDLKPERISEKEEVKDFYSPIANEISNQIGRIQELINRIKDVKDRLEI